MASGKVSLPHDTHCCYRFLISFARPASLYFVEYVYTHIADSLKIAFELLVILNNTASETFLYKSGAVRGVDWIFLIEVPAWQ